MFEHVRVAGLREYHWGIHLGHQQPSPERRPQAEVFAMGLLTPKTMLEGILILYQEAYQLKRGPGEVQCSADVAEEAHAEILEVLKAHLWSRQDFSWLEEPRQVPRMQRLSIGIKHRWPVTTWVPPKPASSCPEKRP